MAEAPHNAAVSSKRIRSCIACGSKGPKSGLLRIVRATNGELVFDPTGRLGGRGAYVCNRGCLESARQGRLARALKTKIEKEDFERIVEQMRVFEASAE